MSSITDGIAEKLMKLSAARFIGNVATARDVVRSMMEPLCDEIKTDRAGGLIAVIKGENGAGKVARRLLLQAHLDEIGFVVTKVFNDGFVRLSAVGGVDIRTLPASKIIIHGKRDVPAVFTSTPPHLASKENASKFPSLDEIMADTGLENAAEAISAGDFASFDISPALLQNGQITGKSLDNRAGCTALIRAAEIIRESGKLPFDTIFSFSAGEELGNRGAKTAAYEIDADAAIAVDVSFALSPMAPPEYCGIMGKGAMIGVSPVLSREMSDKLREIALDLSIPCQIEVMGGRTSTDADVISLTRRGIPCGLLSVPLKYMHTPIETVCLEDIESTARLLAGYAVRFQ